MNEKYRFGQLLRAHANKELTVDDRMQLEVLAAGEPEREHAVSGFEELHRWMDSERRLTDRTNMPADPSEEADECYRRLAQATARAARQLRTKLNPLHHGGPFGRLRTAVLAPSKATLSKACMACFVMQALLSVAGAGFWSPGPPPLNPHPVDPSDWIARQPLVSVNLVLTSSDPRFSWDDVPDAHSYDVKILTADNKLVLAPSGTQACSEWRLTKEEYRVLKAHPGDLFLRVVALDRVGVGIATGECGLAVL